MPKSKFRTVYTNNTSGELRNLQNLVMSDVFLGSNSHGGTPVYIQKNSKLKRISPPVCGDNISFSFTILQVCVYTAS